MSPQGFSSRGEAIKAMKRQFGQDLSPDDHQRGTHILWQLVLWLPEEPISLSGHASSGIVQHADIPLLPPTALDLTMARV